MKVSVVAIDELKLYVELNSLNSMLLYQWKGDILLKDEAEAGFLAILDLIRRYNIVNVIADLSKCKGRKATVARWVNQEYSEMLIEAGVRKVAIMVPERIFGEFRSQMALGKRAITLLNVSKFTRVEDAQIWFSQ